MKTIYKHAQWLHALSLSIKITIGLEKRPCATFGIFFTNGISRAMKSDFPEAQDFFGAYFHQDWLVEHDTADQVIDDFLRNSDKEVLLLVRNELRTLLSRRLNEMDLRAFLLKELHCYYCYWNEWASGEVWLHHIERKLNESLAD